MLHTLDNRLGVGCLQSGPDPGRSPDHRLRHHLVQQGTKQIAVLTGVHYIESNFHTLKKYQ